MAKKSNWLLGCGLGCAGIVAVFVLLGILAGFLARDARRGFDTAVATRKNLEEKFGAPGDFTPAADGSIPAGRLEIFLSVREATQEYRAGIVRFFSTIPMNGGTGREIDTRPFGERMGTIFRSVRSAVGMGADIGHLLEARNQALLEKEMGIGEYTYIYVLSYYSWLGHSPDDGPGRNANSSNFMERSQPQTHNDLIRMLSNQLDSLAHAADSEEWNQWRADLADEIEKMKINEGRVPWEDSVPNKTGESLEPFRDRLEQTYSSITNPFELARSGQGGQISIVTE